DLAAPPHDAHGDRVVDQERADDQRNIAEHAKVPTERAQHALVFVAARAGLFDQISRGQKLAYGPLYAREVFGRRERDVDAVQFSEAAQRLLRGGDIEHDELRARPVDGADHRHRDLPAVQVEADGGGAAEAIRQLLRQYGALFAQQVEAVQRHRSDVANGGLRFHYRREADVVRERIERGHPALVDSAVGANLEVGPAGEGLHGRPEGARGGVTGEVDGYDHGDSEGDGENRQAGAQQVAPERAEDQRPKQSHARSVL